MKRSIFSLLCVMLVASSCWKLDPEDPKAVRYYGNVFAFNVMNSYYLWVDEISEKLENWKTTEDPVEKVASSRYGDDRWTTLYEDYSAFEKATTGNGKTFGLDFSVRWYDEAHTTVCVVVSFTYADSPARKAGLQRGDVITRINGEVLTPDNYKGLAGKLYDGGSITLGLNDDRNIQMSAIQMYENPVNIATTLNYGGKTIGYLHFSNFTMDAIKDLETAFAQFKAAGIQDLVLDLRYNTGGYVITSQALASMIAPVSVVKNKEIFNRDVYNSNLKMEDKGIERFCPELTYTSTSGQQVSVQPLNVNPGIEHLWVLVTGDTASASEALICGLFPYMDVTLVGEKTYGKYCGGFLYKATEWFDDVEKVDKDHSIDCETGRQAIPTWGIYIIISRYADCNGKTLSMPNGIDPTSGFEVKDAPMDGFALGDPSETMLATALKGITGSATVSSAGAVKSARMREAVPEQVRRPGFGVLLH